MEDKWATEGTEHEHTKFPSKELRAWGTNRTGALFPSKHGLPVKMGQECHGCTMESFSFS